MKKLITILGLSSLSFLSYADNSYFPVISEYWCGPDSGCGGQSQDFSDINAKANHVFVAFALVDSKGNPSFQLNAGVDPQAFKNSIAALKTQATPKKVVLSVGGQGADWTGALNNPNTFTQGIVALLNEYGFDGVDLDIESSSLGSESDANLLIALIKTLRQQLPVDAIITVTPEATTVVNTVGSIGGGWNTMVPVINAEINDLSFIQVQEYNDNPYGDPPGTSQFLEHIYNSWITPFTLGNVVYNGMPANKLVMGVPASTSAANPSYYATPTILTTSIQDLKATYNKDPNLFGGVMTWDSHWDQLNNYAITNTMTENLSPASSK